MRRIGYFLCPLLICLSTRVLANPNEDFEKAIQAFSQTNPNTAYIHLKNVLQQAPEHIPAKVLMGKVLLHKGYFNEAIIEFEEALDAGADIASMLDELATAYLFSGKNDSVISLGQHNTLASSQRFDWHLLAAAASLNKGQTEQAEKHYAAASALQPTSLRLLNSKAALRLKQRRYNEAEHLIRQALQADPENPQSLQLQAEWLQLNANPHRAQIFYEKAVTLSPQDPLLKRALLRNYVSQHKLDEAETTIKQILQYTPDDPYALLLAAWLSAIKQQSESSALAGQQLSAQLWKLTREQIEAQPSRLYSRALLSYVEGSYEKARSDLSSYIELVPADLNAIAILAQIYMRQNDSSLAIQLLEQHTANLNAMPELAQQLTTLYISTNRTNKAEQLVASLRLQYPDNAEFAVLHAAVLKKLAQPAEAVKLINNYESEYGSSALISTNQAIFALEQGDYAKALALIDKQLLKAPQNAGYLNFKAAVLIKMAQPEQAKQILQQLLLRDPTYQPAKFNLAQQLLAENDHSAAITLLEPQIAKGLQYKPAPTLLALAYIRAGRQHEAKELLRKVSAVVPYPPAEELLFDLLMQQKHYAEALTLVNKSLDRSFLNETLLWKKAQLLKLLEKPDDALYQTELLRSMIQTDADKLLRLALLQRELGKFTASEQSLLSAQQLKPQSRLIQLELANHFIQTAQPSAAEKWLNRLKPYAAKDANIQMLVGDVALLQNNATSAVKAFQHALKLAPDFRLVWAKLYQLAKQGVEPELFSHLAIEALRSDREFFWLRRLLAEHYVNQHNSEEAILHYEILLAAGQFTDDVTLYNNLASLLLNDKPTKALEYAETAVKLAPKHAAALDTYGWVLSKNGQYQLAVAALRQANTLDAADPAIRFHLAYTLVKLQRSDEARLLLQELLADTADFADKAEAKALLQQI